MLVVGELFFRDAHHLGGEVVVNVVDLPGGNGHVPGRLNGGAVIVDGSRAANDGPAVVECAANAHAACAVDQTVVAVVQRLHAKINLLAPGERRRGAVFGEVIKGDSVYAHRIAVDPTRAHVGEGVGIDAGDDPVDQAGIVYRPGAVQGGAAGIDLAAGEIIQICALHVEGAACHQRAAVGQVAPGGESQIAVGNSGAAVGDAADAM
ncbi:hypothetical protein D3C79_830360 [compost metagenome]